MNLPRSLILAVLGAAVVAAGCASRAPAPVQERRPAPAVTAKPPVAVPAAKPAAPATATAGRYVVRRGDTLYSIALEHGVDFRDLARWNNLDDPAKIRVGQSLQVSSPEGPQAAQAGAQVGAVRAPGAPESRPLESRPPGQASASDGTTRTAPKALRLPYSEQNVALLSRGESPAPAAAKPPAQGAAPAPKPEPPKPAPERNADGIDFIWPAKGAILAGFSEPRVKGIDIGGRIGDPVVAAAAGKVIYVGAGIPGLGKFVVIKHNDELSTVYAHAREVLVKMDQSVVRGQRIAELGDSDADRPKLHFQVRRLGKPLDPMGYLPPG